MDEGRKDILNRENSKIQVMAAPENTTILEPAGSGTRVGCRCGRGEFPEAHGGR